MRGANRPTWLRSLAKFLKVLLIADLVALAALGIFTAIIGMLPFDWGVIHGLNLLDPDTASQYVVPLFGLGVYVPMFIAGLWGFTKPKLQVRDILGAVFIMLFAGALSYMAAWVLIFRSG